MAKRMSICIAPAKFGRLSRKIDGFNQKSVNDPAFIAADSNVNNDENCESSVQTSSANCLRHSLSIDTSNISKVQSQVNDPTGIETVDVSLPPSDDNQNIERVLMMDCFNAVVQAIFCIPHFKQSFILACRFLERHRLLNPIKTSLFFAAYDVLKRHHMSSIKVMATTVFNVANALQKAGFSYEQNVVEVSDLLMYLLAKFDDELNEMRNVVVIEQWKCIESQNPVSRNFRFKFGRFIYCTKCNFSKHFIDEKMALELSLINTTTSKSSDGNWIDEKDVTLQHLLDKTLVFEVVESFCGCSGKLTSIEIRYLVTFPELLILILKRNDCRNASELEYEKVECGDEIKIDQNAALSQLSSWIPGRKKVTGAINSGCGQEIQFMEHCYNKIENNTSNLKNQSYVEEKDDECIEVIMETETDFVPVRISSRAFREKACALFGIRLEKNCVFDEWSESIWIHKCSPSTRKHNVTADGNCLFRALSFCMTGGSERSHVTVRSKIADFQMRYGDKFRLLYGMSAKEWVHYVKEVGTLGVWGSDKELDAAATMLNADIWTYYGGKWLAYRPRFIWNSDDIVIDVPPTVDCSESRDSIYLENFNMHYDVVMDVVNNRCARYRLYSVIDCLNGCLPYVAWTRKDNFWFHCNKPECFARISEVAALEDFKTNGCVFIFEKLKQTESMSK